MYAKYCDDVRQDIISDIAGIAVPNLEPGGYRILWKILADEPSEDEATDINAIRIHCWELEERQS